ncbi:uncharacterized protein ACIBXB_006260 [Morphnus guianensis]
MGSWDQAVGIGKNRDEAKDSLLTPVMGPSGTWWAEGRGVRRGGARRAEVSGERAPSQKEVAAAVAVSVGRGGGPWSSVAGARGRRGPRRAMAQQQMSSSQKALMLELKSLQEEPVEGFRITLVDESDLYNWEVAIFGPPNTLYEGGYFKLLALSMWMTFSYFQENTEVFLTCLLLTNTSKMASFCY